MNLKTATSDIQTTLRDYVGIMVFITEGIIFILLVVNFFVPTYQKIVALRAEISQKETELASLSSYANYLVELAISSLAVEEEIINYALPSENDVVTLIVTYEGLAKMEGLEEVSPISLAPGVLQQEKEAIEEGQTGVQQVLFAMEIKAENEEAADAIIQEITNTSRIFDILNLSIREIVDANHGLAARQHGLPPHARPRMLPGGKPPDPRVGRLQLRRPRLPAPLPPVPLRGRPGTGGATGPVTGSH